MFSMATSNGAMTMLTLGEAARLTGKGKTTLARMIKRGVFSATRTDTGTYMIDAAELARAVPFPAPTAATGATDAAPGSVVQHAPPDAITDELIVTLHQALADMRSQRDDAMSQRDHWRGMAERLALPAPAPRKRWWQRAG
jgi:excisionase family DNA binding protein